MFLISLIMDTCKSVNAWRTTASPSPWWYSPFQRPAREHPTGRSISCGVSDAPTSSQFSAFSSQNSLRRRVFSGARQYRDPRTPSSTSCYYFDCLACLCCCFFLWGGSSSFWGLLPGPFRTSDARVTRPPPPAPPLSLRNERTAAKK